MSDTNGCFTTNLTQQIAPLEANMLSGDDVPSAPTTAQFTKTNNAWSVVCVKSETPPDAPFLITRNVFVGPQINAKSDLKILNISPFYKTRAVWVTRAGSCFDARAKFITAAILCPITNVPNTYVTNETYDVMYP